MRLNNLSTILVLFICWRVLLFIIAFLSIYLFPEFGARFPYYRELLHSTGYPYWVWGFGNFDGVHYLNIAMHGYAAQYTQVFFPLYPLLMNLFAFSKDYFLVGMIISNLAFFLSLLMLTKLYTFDYDSKTSLRSLLVLLLFPTAFYFGALYTESLFLLLTVTSIYLYRKNHILSSGIFAFLGALTRLFGIMLVLFHLVEGIEKNRPTLKLWMLLAAPLGLLIYMLYLQIQFNDPIYFLNAQPVFGAERSSQPFVLLPQVFFRYLKILFTVPVQSVGYFNAALEFFMTIAGLLLIIFSWKKVRMSYWVFSVGSFLLPTLTGTLSSMPRYVLILFLLFPVIAKLHNKFYLPILVFLGSLQILLLSLFIRGYWVS